MQTLLQLEVQGTTLSSHVQNLIATHLRKIEDRYGGVTGCRVVIRAPGEHHHMGEPFGITIQVALPDGREVNVGRISNSRDPRQADIVFAINDAFRRAVRQLQRQARRLEGDSKHHNGAPIGRIVSLVPEKSCGFLVTEDGQEIYFHAHSVLGGHFAQLMPGDRVAYHEEKGEHGPQASTVRILGRVRHI